MNDREYESLRAVIDASSKTHSESLYFPETYCTGKVLIADEAICSPNEAAEDDIEAQVDSQVWSYIVQEKLGDTMEKFLFTRNEPFSEKTVLQIGIQLLEAFKIIHEAGYIFNDLKLDNILIGDASELPQSR